MDVNSLQLMRLRNRLAMIRWDDVVRPSGATDAGRYFALMINTRWEWVMESNHQNSWDRRSLDETVNELAA